MAKGRRSGNGDGSIYQRESDSRWVGSFVADGKRRYVYARSYKDARDKLRKAQQEHEQGTLIDPSKQKVGEYLEYWLDVHQTTIRDTTSVRYRSHLRNHIIPSLGHITLQKLTPDQIQACYVALLTKKLKGSSIHLVHTIFKCALADAVEWGKINKNPCAKVKLPRSVKPDIMPLTKEQTSVFLEAIIGHRFECLFTVALATAMREGELMALHWDDIDWSRNVVQVSRSLKYIPGRGHFEEEPKSASGKRTIALAQVAIDALKLHKTRQVEKLWQAGIHWQEKCLVFANARGGYLWPQHIQVALKRILVETGLPDIRFHDLRHTSAVALIMMGVHPKVIQEILGHSSITITMNIYGHVFLSMQQDAMSHMNTFLSRKSQIKEVM